MPKLTTCPREDCTFAGPHHDHYRSTGKARDRSEVPDCSHSESFSHSRCYAPRTPQPAAVVLPTVDEVADVPRSGDGLRFYSDSARDILDLIAARLPVWQPVEPGTVIKAGTRVREDWDDQITEWTLGDDEDPYASRSRSSRYWLDPRTVPVEPVDPRVAVVGEWLDSIGGEEHTADDVRDMLARLDAVRADA